MKFSPKAQEGLAHYVYCLIDPRDNKIFYVGKGVGNRVFDHITAAIKDESSTDKLNLIREIIADPNCGGVDFRILRHGMKEEETAFEVESTIIDLLTSPLMDNLTKSYSKMTNEVSGHHQFDRGIKTIDDIELFYAAQPLEIAEGDYPLFVSINGTYSKDADLYEAVRKSWVISKNKIPKITHVLGVYHNIVRAVYKPEIWQHPDNGLSKRWEFIGKELTDSPYLNKDITSVTSFGRGNPVAYIK